MILFDVRQAYNKHKLKRLGSAQMPLAEARPAVIPDRAEFCGTSVGYSIRESAIPIDEIPVLIVKGFGGTAVAYEPLRDALADQGKHAINSGTPRSLPLREELNPGNFLHPHRLASRSTAAILEDVHEKYAVEQFDIMVHSKGGRDIMWAAHHLPERIRTIIFVGSVGMGANTLPSFIPRVPQFLRQELPEAISAVGRTVGWRDVVEIGAHFAIRPHRTVGEILAIHSAKVDHRLPEIGALGIKTAVLELANDTLLPPATTRRDIKQQTDHHQTFSEGSAFHVAPITQPKQMAGAITSILEELHSVKSQSLKPSA